MGRAPCCARQGLKKGPWTPEEDKILIDYIQSNGHGSWCSLPKLAGLLRCGKSCRLRWTNYLRPDIKRGPFTPEEQKSIIQLHGIVESSALFIESAQIVGNKWSTIAAQLPGRTDNEIKNYWNTHLKKRLLRMGIHPDTYAPTSPSAAAAAAAAFFPATRHMAQWESARLEAEARLSRDPLLFSACPATASAIPDHPGGASDIFLRIWNSEVGDAFRKLPSSISDHPAEETEPPASNEGTATADASSASNDLAEEEDEEDASDDAYQLYLNLAGAGDDLPLFHGGAPFSIFSTSPDDYLFHLHTAF